MSVASIDQEITTTEQAESPPRTPLKPRRTLNRLALALVGLLAGGIGQFLFSRDSLWDGLLFYVMAVILFNRALAGRLFSDIRLPAVDHPLAIHQGRRQRVGVWLILLALGFSVVAYRFFGQNDAIRQAWWLYWVGLALLVAGGVILTQGHAWRANLDYLLPNRHIAVVLALVIALALFMRLEQFDRLPFGIWYDEAEAGIQAEHMLRQPDYRPIFFPSPINHPIYLPGAYALAMAWLGENIYSMRLVSVFFGLGGVVAAYLFGRELRGPRFGLVLAFLMAVARWPVNFSRIAMTGIDTPFFEFLTLYFLVRLFRGGRLRDAMWAGLSLGAGLMIYTGFRLYVVALILFAFIFALRWPQWLMEIWQKGHRRDQAARLVLLVLTVWMMIMPVVRFALDDPNDFLYRTRQISIFTKRDQPALGKALWESTRRHLLMFNFKGDRNGRHNIPGEPMLDPAMGVLAVLGLGLALARRGQLANSFFLMLFPLSLLGGILSVDFEAPQSLRSIAVLPAVIYFAGLAVAALGREAEATLKPLPRVVVYGPAAALALFITFYNGWAYFERQAQDFSVWNAFSTPETIIGRKMAELGPNYVYYLSPLLMGHPSTRFLAPDVKNIHALNLPDALPIREPPDRPAVLFIHPDDLRLFEEAQRLYPNAGFETAYGPSDPPSTRPAVYMAYLKPADLASLQGLELTYWPNEPANWPPDPGAGADDQLPLHTSRVETIAVTWPTDSPVETDFVADWQGVLYVPQYGAYTLRLTTPGPSRLEIDGHPLLEGPGEQTTTLPLAQGNHAIRLLAQAAPGQVMLHWQPPNEAESLIPQWDLYTPPITNHGLLGTFYPNENWQGQPVLERIDPLLDTYFHLLPMQRPYTVAWQGKLDAPQSGLYRFSLRAVTEAQLFLDNQLLITTRQPDQFTNADITLEAGLHDILVRFKDATDRSRIHLFWSTPSGQTGPIPSENLWPPLGYYPEKPAPEPEIEIQPLSLNWIKSFGGPGPGEAQFFEPRDVATLSNGNMVVADTANRRVQILDFLGNPLLSLSGDEFPFEEPLAVGVNSQDQILVLDSTLQWVYRYDATGNLIDRFGGPTAFLFHPRGLTVFEDDSVAIADTGTSKIALFSADGTRTGSLGSLGSSPGQLNEPTDVLRDARGNYFVAEAMNSRIQRLDSLGDPLNQWAIPPAYAFDGPHLAFGPDRTIFMTDTQNHSLLRYAPDGSLIEQWQTIGPIQLVAPVGIYFDKMTSRLFLTDVRTHEVHVFEVQVNQEK